MEGYDYSQEGAYFFTLCTQDHLCLFGSIQDYEMLLSEAGRMIRDSWEEAPEHYPAVETGAFVVMPNHIHGILILVGADPRVCPKPNPEEIQSDQAAPLKLGDVVRQFKTLTTRRYIEGVKLHSWPPFPKRLWQRNYYEHIIRDEDSHYRIVQYIEGNPAQWDWDQENLALRRPRTQSQQFP